jgi:transcriptional antiterminator RfaH
MERWYVVETHARGEARALDHLRRQGYAVYLPRYRRRRRHARRTDTVAAPLFPGYLFLRMNVAETRWRAVRSTVGVRRLVAEGEAPLPVPEGIVEDILGREDAEGFVPVAPAPPFAPGESVRVVAGPLRDQVGWFQRLADRDRVVVLLSLLGRPHAVPVPLDAVERAV